MLDEKGKQLQEQRGSVYGPWRENMEYLAENWHSLLAMYYSKFGITLPPLPGWLPPMMLSSLKLLRAAYPSVYHKDNYDDERVYLHFAEEMQKAALPNKGDSQ